MADESPRARRLADRVKVIVAQMLELRIKDPRLGFVTVTDAYVTNDLREATVFYTVLGDQVEQQASAMALESAKGVLRTEVGRQTGVRYTPSLTFVPDAVPEHARAIDGLIKKAKANDRRVAKRTEGASYAGDPDPYRSTPDSASETDEVTAPGPTGDLAP